MPIRPLSALVVFFLTLGLTAVGQQPAKLAPKGFDLRRDGIAHGKTELVEYPSSSVGGKRKLTVYTPPGYSKDLQYPVLYLFHGAKFDETSWQKLGLADAILDNLYADKKIAPMIVVMPNGFASKVAGKKDTAAFEDDLLKDIIPWVESHYAVKADREHRAIAGQSMGGGQAVRIGLKHLDRFAWIAGFAPALGGSADLVTDPADVAKKLKLFWLSCGDKDGLLKTLESFHSTLETSKVPHIWHIGEGDHTFPVWKNDFYLLAQLLFRKGEKSPPQELVSESRHKPSGAD